MEEMNNMELDNAVDGVDVDFENAVEGDGDNSAKLGMAILIGGGALIGIAAKTGYDKLIKPHFQKKEDGEEETKEKKPGFLSRFKKDKDEKPETEKSEEPKEEESKPETKPDEKEVKNKK